VASSVRKSVGQECAESRLSISSRRLRPPATGAGAARKPSQTSNVNASAGLGVRSGAAARSTPKLAALPPTRSMSAGTRPSAGSVSAPDARLGVTLTGGGAANARSSASRSFESASTSMKRRSQPPKYRSNGSRHAAALVDKTTRLPASASAAASASASRT
jgi:hypothetical protein